MPKATSLNVDQKFGQLYNLTWNNKCAGTNMCALGWAEALPYSAWSQYILQCVENYKASDLKCFPWNDIKCTLFGLKLRAQTLDTANI